jgi:hypothetical protein
MGWNREKQESTDTTTFYQLEDSVVEQKHQLLLLKRKSSRIKSPSKEESDQLQDSRLKLKETIIKLELEFVRLANLSVSYFPELKLSLRKMAHEK